MNQERKKGELKRRRMKDFLLCLVSRSKVYFKNENTIRDNIKVLLNIKLQSRGFINTNIIYIIYNMWSRYFCTEK